MTYPSPQQGGDANVIRSATVWRDLLAMRKWWKSRRGGTSLGTSTGRDREGGIYVRNDYGRDLRIGELVQCDSTTQPADSALNEAYAISPIIHGDYPTWHTNIGNIVVANSAVEDGALFRLPNKNWATVRCAGQIGSSGLYVMPDPDFPHRALRCSSGIFRVIGYDATNDLATVRIGQSQPLWRYELTQDSQAPNDTTATLKTLDGATFGDINLKDPLSIGEDDLSGYEGYCIHVGNEFHIASGPC